MPDSTPRIDADHFCEQYLASVHDLMTRVMREERECVMEWAASDRGPLRVAVGGRAERAVWGASDGYAPAAAARDPGTEAGAEVR